MKRLIVYLMTVSIFLSIQFSVFSAKSDISVISGEKSTAFSFDQSLEKEKTLDISEVIGEWTDGEDGSYDVKYLTVRLSSADANNSKLYFRLEAQDIAELGHYSFKISTPDGTVLCDDTNTPVQITNNHKDYFMADITGVGDIVKEYIIEYKASEDGIKPATLKPYILLKASEVIEPVATVVPTKTPSKPTPTLKPKFDLGGPVGKQDEISFDFDTGEIINNKPVDEDGDKVIVKICGEDIPAGRYQVTGKGKLEILSSAGASKGTGVITETSPAVAFIENGDIIRITAVDDDTSAKLKFTKISTDAQAPGTVGDTDKTNPKTGENDTNIGLTILFISLVVLAIVGLEIIKRKKNTNN